MPRQDERPLIWLIAGEPSGDLIGAGLMAALTKLAQGKIRMTGIGGEAMADEGLVSRFPISDIAVMGVVEVLPRVLLIRRRIRETVTQILADRPDVVVSIDSPGFNYRVWKGLETAGIPLVHYVAPSVWVWNPGRASKFAARLDHLIALLPFEPPYFEKEGLPCTFAGHPALECGAGAGDGAAFRSRHGISPDSGVICVLPGSRRGELARLMPVFRDTATHLARCREELVYVIPAVDYLKGEVEALAKNWPGRVVVLNGPEEKYDAMAASQVGMAASGTVSLELALAKVPHIIAYRLNPLSMLVFRLLGGRRQKFANLINILTDEEIIPELILGKCRADLISKEVLKFLDREDLRVRQATGSKTALAMLHSGAESPSLEAAKVVLACAEKGKAK